MNIRLGVRDMASLGAQVAFFIRLLFLLNVYIDPEKCRCLHLHFGGGALTLPTVNGHAVLGALDRFNYSVVQKRLTN